MFKICTFCKATITSCKFLFIFSFHISFHWPANRSLCGLHHRFLRHQAALGAFFFIVGKFLVSLIISIFSAIFCQKGVESFLNL